MGLKFKSVQKLDKKLHEEYVKQTGNVYGAASIALYNEWGWKQKRLESLFSYIKTGLIECAGFSTKKSMLEMLEEETGIEMKLHENGKSYHEIDYLNGALGMYEIDNMSYAQIMAMRIGQIKWVKATVEASLFLALHRKNGFGAERIQRLLDQIFDIEKDHKENTKAITEECTKLTGIDVFEIMEKRG